MDEKKIESKFEKIKKENAKFEKIAPYNFCDRWCERCLQEKRDRCRIYQGEFDRALKHIVKGKDPYDWNVVIEEVKENFDKTIKLIQKWAQKENIDLSQIDDSQYDEQKKKERQLLDHPLYKLAMKYCRDVSSFIKETFYEKQEIASVLIVEYETLIWYHTLLPVKVRRFLCELYIKEIIDDLDIYDAVAQIDITKKAIVDSQRALKKVLMEELNYRHRIFELLDILHEIARQIKAVEEGINKNNGSVA